LARCSRRSRLADRDRGRARRQTLSPALGAALEAMLCYKRLWMVERAFRTSKSLFATRPIFQKLDETIRGHVSCSFLARREIGVGPQHEDTVEFCVLFRLGAVDGEMVVRLASRGSGDCGGARRSPMRRASIFAGSRRCGCLSGDAAPATQPNASSSCARRPPAALQNAPSGQKRLPPRITFQGEGQTFASQLIQYNVFNT